MEVPTTYFWPIVQNYVTEYAQKMWPDRVLNVPTHLLDPETPIDLMNPLAQEFLLNVGGQTSLCRTDGFIRGVFEVLILSR